MIHLSSEQLKQLQAIQLDMLLEVKRICEKHKIKYSLIGGTLLGAVRHKGYIPWDDDADVGMLRKDYEKFRRLCETELDREKYYFQDDRNTKEYRWGYGKLRKKNTLFLRENQKHLNFGQEIFIDIFPLDYAPDNILLRCFHMFHCFCIRKILWSTVGVTVEKSGYKHFLYKALSHISKEQVYRHYYKYIKRRRPTNTIRLNLFPTRKPYGFPIQYFEELTEVEFEGERFMGSRYYHEYLTIKYGDYMKMPPVEARKTHSVVEIRF